MDTSAGVLFQNGSAKVGIICIDGLNHAQFGNIPLISLWTTVEPYELNKAEAGGRWRDAPTYHTSLPTRCQNNTDNRRKIQDKGWAQERTINLRWLEDFFKKCLQQWCRLKIIGQQLDRAATVLACVLSNCHSPPYPYQVIYLFQPVGFQWTFFFLVPFGINPIRVVKNN